MSEMEFVEAGEASGKTVVDIKESAIEEIFVITFTDKTYTMFCSDAYCDQVYNKNIDCYGDDVKKEFGIITAEEYDNRKKNEATLLDEKNRQYQLALYNRLKKKFEPVLCSSCRYSHTNQNGPIPDFTKCEPCENNANCNIELVLEIGGLQNNYETVDLK